MLPPVQGRGEHRGCPNIRMIESQGMPEFVGGKTPQVHGIAGRIPGAVPLVGPGAAGGKEDRVKADDPVSYPADNSDGERSASIRVRPRNDIGAVTLIESAGVRCAEVDEAQVELRLFAPAVRGAGDELGLLLGSAAEVEGGKIRIDPVVDPAGGPAHAQGLKSERTRR